MLIEQLDDYLEIGKYLEIRGGGYAYVDAETSASNNSGTASVVAVSVGDQLAMTYGDVTVYASDYAVYSSSYGSAYYRDNNGASGFDSDFDSSLSI